MNTQDQKITAFNADVTKMSDHDLLKSIALLKKEEMEIRRRLFSQRHAA